MAKKSNQKKLRVPVSNLYHACDLSDMSFKTTDELEPAVSHVGQTRAMDALKFGIGIKHEGYNLYVLGSTGLGKHTTVKKLLDDESSEASIPSDWCYINNFKEPHSPHCLELPAGRACKLQDDMLQLVDDILVAIPVAFESEDYHSKLQAIDDEFKEREEKMFNELSDKADKNNVAMLRTPGGYTLGPMRDGKVLPPAEFDKLSEKEKKQFEEIIEEIENQLKEIIRKIPVWQKESRERIKQLNRDISKLTIDQFVDEVASDYSDLPEVTSYINEVEKDIVENVDIFRKYGEERKASPSNHEMLRSLFSRYYVNVLVDNSETNGAPVIYEDNPSYQNLVGRVEHMAQYGTLITDFTMIKSGALHRANGGYLMLDARKVLTSPFAWEGLKRVLRAREVRIESLEKMLSLASTTSLQPEPIPIKVKIVLTGSRLLYYLLKEYDPEFSMLFKVAADFAEDMDRDARNTELYVQLIATLQKENELQAIDKEGVVRIIEHCSRMVDDGEKISLHIGGLLDLLKESDYWARQEKRKTITQKDVQKVIDSRLDRLNQLRERVQEQVLRGIHLIDTSGEKVAQVNGLSVLQLGDYSFGRPTRITATARIGAGKVIDIEREVDLGGPIHSKGVLILSSYLANRYSKERPLSLSASLVFEQSYGRVEGDSASAAELCALLSALAEVPIQQSIAVTGSVNQQGEIQAIGGVNEKVEGFFDICNARGLTGHQGVVIPATNRVHLMLRDDVRDAVKKKKFEIYAVNSIDEMIEILTGKEAGQEDAEGNFPENTFNALVEQKLQKLSDLRQQFSKSDKSRQHEYKRKH